MTVQLSQKERTLLQDQVKHEEICIQKYNDYASQAQDPQLKQLFQSYAQEEQQHKDSLNQMLSGSLPQLSGSQSQSNQQAFSQSMAPLQSNTMEIGQMEAPMSSPRDAEVCKDMLMTEKFISGSYDNTIFQFCDSNVRQVLNHIQKEEQQHGEGISQYMKQRGLS